MAEQLPPGLPEWESEPEELDEELPSLEPVAEDLPPLETESDVLPPTDELEELNFDDEELAELSAEESPDEPPPLGAPPVPHFESLGGNAHQEDDVTVQWSGGAFFSDDHLEEPCRRNERSSRGSPGKGPRGQRDAPARRPPRIHAAQAQAAGIGRR